MAKIQLNLNIPVSFSLNAGSKRSSYILLKSINAITRNVCIEEGLVDGRVCNLGRWIDLDSSKCDPKNLVRIACA